MYLYKCINIHILYIISLDYFDFYRRSFGPNRVFRLAKKMKVPFSMAIGHGELVHECFPKHSRMRTARMK